MYTHARKIKSFVTIATAEFLMKSGSADAKGCTFGITLASWVPDARSFCSCSAA